jgi:hypothetical protein
VTGTGAEMGRLGLAEFANATLVSAGTHFGVLQDGATAEDFRGGDSVLWLFNWFWDLLTALRRAL